MGKDDNVVLIGGGLVIGGFAVYQACRVVENAINVMSNEINEWSASPSIDLLPVFGIGTAGAIGWAGFKIYQAYQTKEPAAVHLYPKAKMKFTQNDISKMMNMFHSISHGRWEKYILGRVWLRWMIQCDGEGEIHYSVYCPRKLADAVAKIVRAGYPEIETMIDYSPVLLPEMKRVGHMKLYFNNAGWGIAADNNMHAVLSIMPKNSVIDIRFSPGRVQSLLKAGRQGIRNLFGKRKTRDDGEYTILKEKEAQEKAIRERYMGHVPFDVSINLFAEKASIIPIANALTSSTKGLNSLSLKPYRFFEEYRNPLRWPFVTPLPWRRMKLTDAELASMIGFPAPAHNIYERIAIADEGSYELKANEFSSGIKIGTNKHKNQADRSVKVPYDHWRYHGVIWGATGQGKGATAGEIMRSFVDGWLKAPDRHPGMTLLDPHAQTGELLFNILLEKQRQGHIIPWHRVKYLHFGNTEYPVGMNLLDKEHGDDVGIIAKEATETILSAFPGDLSQSRVELENALLTLLYDNESHTIDEVIRIFMDDSFRAKILERIGKRNPSLYNWWRTMQEKNIRQNIAPILTRLNPFITNPTMQRLYCQPGSVLNIKEILDGGYIVFVDFKGSPPEAKKLSAGYIAARYHREMNKRPGLGRIHILTVDEAQLFEVPTFGEIMREDRKFGFGLWLMTQDLAKLGKELAKAVMVNAHTYVALNPGPGASDLAEKILNQKYSAKYLESLKPLNAAVFSKIEQVKVAVKIDPPAFLDENGELTQEGSPQEAAAKRRAVAKMKELQRRDGKYYKEVDEEIRRRILGEVVSEPKREVIFEEKRKRKQKKLVVFSQGDTKPHQAKGIE